MKNPQSDLEDGGEGGDTLELSLIIDGKTLIHALHESIRKDFIRLVMAVLKIGVIIGTKSITLDPKSIQHLASVCNYYYFVI